PCITLLLCQTYTRVNLNLETGSYNSKYVRTLTIGLTLRPVNSWLSCYEGMPYKPSQILMQTIGMTTLVFVQTLRD
ncbi:hypothetical protein ScPMuIL_007308, partial [Solemya velum]